MTECCGKEIAALKELLLAMLAARDTAVELAASTLANRLDGMNGFRNQLTAQTAKFITRLEHEALLEQIGALQSRQSAQETRLLLGGTGIIVVLMTLQLIFNYVLHH